MVKRFAIVAVFVTLISCGGGGGGPAVVADSDIEISGQAVTGAPMSSAVVSFMIPNPYTGGGNWQKIGTADSTGNFKLNNSTIKKYGFPILIRAVSSDGSKTHYSLVNDSAQSNLSINPLTSVQITLALNGSADANYKNTLTSSNLSSAKTKLDSVFANVFTSAGYASQDNYFAHTFSPNHTGLDMILDSVDVGFQLGGKINITNKITGQNISVSQGSISTLPFSSSDITSMIGVPLQACSTMLESLTSTKMLADDNIYAANFLDSGMTKDSFRTYIRSIVSSLSQFQLGAPVFAGVDSNGSYIFNFNIVNINTRDYLASFEIPVAWMNSTNDCRLVGNQFPFEIYVQPIIRKLIRTDSLTSTYATEKSRGVEIKVGGEPFQNSINGTVIAKAKAKVELCDATNSCQLLADLVAPSGSGTFELANQNLGFHYVIPNPTFSLFNTLPNPVRVKLLDSSDNLLATYSTRSKGVPFSDEEFNAITMPIVRNANTVIGTQASSILNTGEKLMYDNGSTVLTSIHVGSRNGVASTDNTKLILSDSPGEISVPLLDTSNASYRAIWLNGQLPGRAGKVITKYIWAPQTANAW